MSIKTVANAITYPVVGYLPAQDQSYEFEGIVYPRESSEVWVIELGDGIGASVASIRGDLEILPILAGKLLSSWDAVRTDVETLDDDLRNLRERVVTFRRCGYDWDTEYMAGFSAESKARRYPGGYDTTPSVRYVAGWNMVGYLPETEPVEFDSPQDARAYLTEELGRWMDQAYDNDEHEVAARLNRQAREMYDGHENTAGIYVEDASATYSFWIVEAEQD